MGRELAVGSGYDFLGDEDVEAYTHPPTEDDIGLSVLTGVEDCSNGGAGRAEHGVKDVGCRKRSRRKEPRRGWR